ncbi:eukaryotic translation initiation factor 4E type 2-like [Sturnira hondurensis]|uniref:eukaryotic translation initiation factor 4E type 2-like n=1 Tax=Sturnira hondurensis TaxID=192404 RepID=UPI00187A658A|nr:eukaryotic translation initiation factor 4E type 2-like [Sturnira hondurensis]
MNKFDTLKDDDRGDNDQNEETSIQKDGEEEKWNKTKNCAKSITQIGTFASVEQFLSFYSHIIHPRDLTGHSDFHLFKEEIKPMWEDDANKNGGKWIIQLWKGLASHCWETFMLAMLGEQFTFGKEICGAVVSIQFHTNQATTAQIWATLWQVLNLLPNTIMEYKTHNDSIQMPGRLGPSRLLSQTLWKLWLRLNGPQPSPCLDGTSMEAGIIGASCVVCVECEIPSVTKDNSQVLRLRTGKLKLVFTKTGNSRKNS